MPVLAVAEETGGDVPQVVTLGDPVDPRALRQVPVQPPDRGCRPGPGGRRAASGAGRPVRRGGDRGGGGERRVQRRGGARAAASGKNREVRMTALTRAAAKLLTGAMTGSRGAWLASRTAARPR